MIFKFLSQITIVEDLFILWSQMEPPCITFISECKKEILSHVSTRDSTSVGGVCCCLAENRFLLGERNIPSKTKIRKLANHAKNNLFLPKTTVYGRKNILRVFAQLTNVTFQLI